MVNFIVGINRYKFQDGSKEIIEKLVSDLNKIFWDKKCPLHPSERWTINVDLLKTGAVQFSSMKQDGCDYALTLINEEIMPYLERIQIFPLPVE